MTWIEYTGQRIEKDSIAIVGSPGQRSIGKIAVDYLIKNLRPRLVAELYSPYFPILYETKPSYATHPEFPGQAGINLQGGLPELLKVGFYSLSSPSLLLTKGYHANFNGQYEVAEQVLDFYQKFGVKKIIVLAGYGMEGRDVCCAATDLELIKELKKYGIDTGYEGPFYGFSGLIFGLCILWNIKGICLFGRTQPNLLNPEYPDPNAARAVLERLRNLLNLSIDLSKINEITFRRS
ncbi:MAG: PAC2 family protein [Candidatus Methylarchaceae archaeon HK02M2]|nr:PAC2 family protein [Candidatus Methylarchaceae archaeon HK02M2]